MDLEQIVQHILTVRHDLSQEDILKKIYEKKRSAEDYFIDEVAARLVASELGVELPNTEDSLRPEIAIKDLVTGLNNVTIIGKVTEIYPVQTFSRSDLTEGKVARLLLVGKTGTIKVVLWDEQVQPVEAEKIQPGQRIKVSHGYVREGLNGKPELHVGKRGELKISPLGQESELPATATNLTKISALKPNMNDVNVLARVCKVDAIRQFRRSTGQEGQVASIHLLDETGPIQLNLWNEQTEAVENIKVGDAVLVEHAYTRLRFDRTELNLGTRGNLTPNPPLPEAKNLPPAKWESPPSQKRKINDIISAGGPFTVEATVDSQPETKQITTRKNEKILLTSFDIADETGKIRVSLWRDQAEAASDFTVGTKLRLTNMYAKRGFSNILELTSRRNTTIEMLSNAEAAAQSKVH